MMAGEIRERIRFNFIKGATITEGRGSHRGDLYLLFYYNTQSTTVKIEYSFLQNQNL
jgi:hypothetical protein